jgi:signal transduction histidine kinase
VAIGIAFSVMSVVHTRNRVRRLRERVTLIEQLTRSREREAEANRMKSKFIASVSHELRTPLNSILGFSELVRDLPDHPGNARRADLIHSSGQHLLALLNTLLDLAKIEAGRMEVQRAEVNLVGTVRTLADVHRASATRKGITLEFTSELPATHTALAHTDATKFKQVLNNVLSNAVKFTSTGGVHVFASVDGEIFTVRVDDTGRGIRPDQLSRIFDRFSTAAAPGSAQEEGTGLGLSLSRELVRLLGGSIRIASRPDQGTQVTLCLPGARLA